MLDSGSILIKICHLKQIIVFFNSFQAHPDTGRAHFIGFTMKIVCLLIWVVQVRFVFSEKKQLNLMGLLPMTGNLFRGGKACLLAANLALRHVNARDDVLDEFKLNLIWRDTKVTMCNYCRASQA